MNIVYVFSDSAEEWNCSEWRCAIPARAVNSLTGHSAQLLSIQEFAAGTPACQRLCRAADVIVVQRNLFGPVLDAIVSWKAQGKTLVADFDDAYDRMPSTVKNHRFWRLGEPLGEPAAAPARAGPQPKPLTQFRWGLRLVDAATVPSRRLADDWAGVTRVQLLPNYIEVAGYERARREPHEGIVIGWGGSISHLQSFQRSGILPALRAVCAARPEVRVVIDGGDRRIFDLIDLPPERKLLRPWVSHADWPGRLATFDIGLAPLAGDYDQRRSWIKVLEYMLMGIPWAASDGPAYAELGGFGHLVGDGERAWEQALLDLVDNLAARREHAEAEARAFARAQGSLVNAERIVATYAQLATPPPA